MPAVVLAVAPRAHSVLPGLAPINGAKADQDAAARKCLVPLRVVERGALLENMIAALIVVQTRGEARKLWAEKVAFRGVQIAARRIAAQRPALGAIRFPRRKAERELKQDRDRFEFESACRGQSAATKIVIARGKGVRAERQPHLHRAHELPKRVGLIGPIKLAGSGRVAIQAVLAALVIGLKRLR